MSNDLPNPNPTKTDDQRWQEAERLADAGQFDGAVDAYRQFCSHPQLAAVAQLRLSLLASVRGHYREAVSAALAAFDARLAEPELIRSIADRLKSLGEIRTMYACTQDFSVLRGSNPEVLFGLGRMLVGTGFPTDGLQLLQRAHNAGLQGPQMNYQVALGQRALGHHDVAANALAPALADGPYQAPALLAMSELPTSVAFDVARLAGGIRGALGRRRADDPQLPMLLYALFVMLDRVGDTDAAWHALEQGMQMRRVQLPYDPAATQALFEHLGAMGPAPVTDPPADAVASEEPPHPVFVVGMPGSGIELLAQWLAGHPDVTDLGELRDFILQLRWCSDLEGLPTMDLALAQRASDIDFAELGQRYLAHVQWRAPGKLVFLDRNPANLACLPYIARALPQARILHMVSAPMDTCFAGLTHWSSFAEPWSHDQVEMADQYRHYRTLMAQARVQYPSQVLDVRHDELLANPQVVLREVLAFCGLSECELPAPATDEPVQPWRRYDSQLAALRQRLGALAY